MLADSFYYVGIYVLGVKLRDTLDFLQFEVKMEVCGSQIEWHISGYISRKDNTV